MPTALYAALYTGGDNGTELTLHREFESAVRSLYRHVRPVAAARDHEALSVMHKAIIREDEESSSRGYEIILVDLEEAT